MSGSQPTEVAVSFYERISGHDAAGAAALVAADYVGHGMGGGGGPDSVQRDVETWLQAVPDLEIVIRDVIAQGDRAVVRMHLRGTHRGVFAGIPASERSFEIGGTDVLRVADGRIVEAWTLCDLASMFAQIGALPTRA